MTVTVASFRAAFPAFQVANYPDVSVDFYISFALLRHNAERWGNLLDMGVMLFAAHNLSLESNAAAAQTSGQGAGAVIGQLTSISAAEGVGWSRAAIKTDPQDGHWALTSYGLRWKEMARMMGAGGLQIGLPSPEDLQTQQAWPGPFPAVW